MKKIVITGSSGLIGKKLSQFLEKKNFEIINLQRVKLNFTDSLNWKLGETLPKDAIGADIFIHCAHDNSVSSMQKKIIKNINYTGSKKLFDEIRMKSKYEIYYLSSQTSNEYSKSYYGKLKFNIEKLLKTKNRNIEVIIRPGIVYSKENSYITELLKKLSKFKVFPFFSFKKNVQPIDIDDLVECIYRIISSENKQDVYNLGAKYKMNIRDYIKFVCKDNNLPLPYFIYIPYHLVILIAASIDFLKFTKFSLLERIYGLVFLPHLDSKQDLQNINYSLKKDFLK